MVTAGAAGNTAPRVTTCQSCGRRIEAGRRGPLPLRCDACKTDDLAPLRYRIATARNLALELDRADVAAALDRAGELLPNWQRWGQ